MNAGLPSRDNRHEGPSSGHTTNTSQYNLDTTLFPTSYPPSSAISSSSGPPSLRGPDVGGFSGDLARHQASLNGPISEGLAGPMRVPFPFPGAKPVMEKFANPIDLSYGKAQASTSGQPVSTDTIRSAGEDIGESIAVFLEGSSAAAADPGKQILWTELIRLKTKNVELQITEARRKEREAELELERLKQRFDGTALPRNQEDVRSALAQLNPGQLLTETGTTPSGSVPQSEVSLEALWGSHPFGSAYAREPQETQAPAFTGEQPGQALQPASLLAGLPLQFSQQVLPPMTPIDLGYMMQGQDLDSLLAWLPDFGEHTMGDISQIGDMTPFDLQMNSNSNTAYPPSPALQTGQQGSTTSTTAPILKRSASVGSENSASDPPAKKSKRQAEKKIVVEHSAACATCSNLIGKIMVRAPKSLIPDPIRSEFRCLSCLPLDPPPDILDQTTSGAIGGTVETRKRLRGVLEGEDQELEATRRRVFCDVCQRVVGSGVVMGGESGEEMSHMAEVVCTACDTKYQRCTDCGGGGGPRVGIGKWRMKQVFQPGRKTCSLSHNRLGDRQRELGVHVTPSDFTPEQLKEVVTRCKALWTEKSYARLAVPEIMEVDLSPHLSNPIRSYEDIEYIVTKNWPTREAMIRADGADPGQFKRLLGLTWAHSRPRRSVRTVDLEEQYQRATEEGDNENMCTVLANIKRTNVVIPAGCDLIGMWGGEWDASLLVSTFVPFEGADGEDNTALSVGELISKVNELQQSLNAERKSDAVKVGKPADLIRQCEHLWVCSSNSVPIIRERVADILVRKRSFINVDEYVTRHPDFSNALQARPLGMHPNHHRPMGVQGKEGDGAAEKDPLVLVRWLGKDFDAAKILEIKQAEFGGKKGAKLKRMPKSRV